MDLPHAACYSFSAALFVLIVIERVTNACATLFVRLVWGRVSSSSAGQGVLLGNIISQLRSVYDVQDRDIGDPNLRYLLEIHESMSSARAESSSMHDVKGYASMQMVGAGVTLFSSVTSAVLSCVLNAISALSMYVIWATAAMLVFSLLFVLQENYSDVLVDAVNQYNSTYGPILHKLVFIPLQVKWHLKRRCFYEDTHTSTQTHTQTHTHIGD